jgi:hypothetical protein
VSPELAVPAYFHPAVAAADWALLTASASSVSAVILNIDSGPGSSVEPSLSAAVSLAAAAGVPVLGYVDTAYGSRSLREITVDMGRYRSWYPVSGFFLDQASSAGRYAGFYGDLVAAASALGADRTVLNHGIYPDRQYAELPAELVTYEGSWDGYAEAGVPRWARSLPPTRFWHLIYGAPAAALPEVLSRIGSRAGTVYVTDRRGANPWDGLPSYFAALTTLDAEVR